MHELTAHEDRFRGLMFAVDSKLFVNVHDYYLLRNTYQSARVQPYQSVRVQPDP